MKRALRLAALVAFSIVRPALTEDGTRRFVDGGNGTVADAITGLMWQKEDDGTKRTYDEAIVYCSQLRLAGYSDWRLPAPDEITVEVKDALYRAPREDAAAALGHETVRMFEQMGVRIAGADRYWTSAPNRLEVFNMTPKGRLDAVLSVSRDTPLFVRAVRAFPVPKARADAGSGLSDEEMITSIKTNPRKVRFCIKEIRPQANSYKGKVTILEASGSACGPVLMKHEHAQYDSRGNAVFPMGQGSVHVYRARFEIGLSATTVYAFEGTPDDPLVFALIEPLGYVYLHGTGTVYLPNGTKANLGK